MLNNDLKIIIELMELAGKDQFACVCIKDGVAYATNGIGMASRPVENVGNTFVMKEDLPMLKALYAKCKKLEYIDEDVTRFFKEEFKGFPRVEMLPAAFNNEFTFEVTADANTLIKMIKSFKGKSNEITLKLRDATKPVLVVHENGKGLIAPIVK